MIKNLRKMEISDLVKGLDPNEPKVTVCLYIHKSTREAMVKLANMYIPGKRRGKLSKFAQLIFNEIAKKNLDKL